MKSLRGRLKELEDALNAQDRTTWSGALEMHYTEAWPDCQSEPGFQQCSFCNDII